MSYWAWWYMLFAALLFLSVGLFQADYLSLTFSVLFYYMAKWKFEESVWNVK